MNDRSHDPTSATWEGDLARARSLSEQGQHVAALRHLATLLQRHPQRDVVLAVASRALIAAATDESALKLWDDSERDWFYATLILQQHCNISPPILHHQIAGQHTSGIPDAIARMSSHLGPTIAKLLRRGPINKNLILLILLLRESLGPWLPQSRISQLHAQWLGRFTANDLAIPYNCMFDPVTFRRNKDDVVAFLFAAGNGADQARQLSFSHLLIFEWLTQRDLLGDDRLLELLAERAAHGPLADDELAAVRSLLVRHWRQDWLKQSARLQACGVDSGTLDLARTTHDVRIKLRAAAAADRATIGMRLVDNRIWQGLQAARGIARRKLASAPARRRPRIAICVSGQLRGYRQAFQSWTKTLLDDIDYELFVHSWRRIGRSGAEPFRSDLPFAGRHFIATYREACLGVGLDEFRSHYPSLFQTLADTGNVTEDELMEFYGTSHVHLDDENEPAFAALSNQEKMHSKIEACFAMAAATGRGYDLMVRLRPDRELKLIGYAWADILALCRASPTLFADHPAGLHYANPMIGDQFAIGAPETMRVYSTTWTRSPQFAARGLLRLAQAFEGHVSLAQICWLHGICVRKIPIRFGSLAEPERLSCEIILRCLKQDAAPRMNRMDQLLLNAAASDIKSLSR